MSPFNVCCLCAASEHSPAPAQVLLVGTKHDLWCELGGANAAVNLNDENGVTSWDEGFAVARAIGAVGFVCTSAKTKYGVFNLDEGGASDTLLDSCNPANLKGLILDICESLLMSCLCAEIESLSRSGIQRS